MKAFLTRAALAGILLGTAIHFAFSAEPPAPPAKAPSVAMHVIIDTLDGHVKAFTFVDQYGDIAPVSIEQCNKLCMDEAKRLLDTQGGAAIIHLTSACIAQRPDLSPKPSDTQL